MSTMRELFGPSRTEVWRQLSSEIDANFVEGSFLKKSKIEARHRQWTILLDTFTVVAGKAVITFTRMRAPYVNPDGFRFEIYRRGLFTELGKFMGMQDVEVGHPDFDRDFVIKGTDWPKLRTLFANAKIRELISAQPNIHFEVKDKDSDKFFGEDFPADTDVLRFHVRGIIKDIDRLKLLFELFAETLDELCRLGSAYDTEPELRL